MSAAHTPAHTPAPWTVLGNQIKSIDHGKWYTVATANNPKFTDEANANNARLIAAAPDLLKALRALVSTARTFRNVPKEEQEWTSIDDDALKAAFAAIAKATGGAA